MTPLSQQALNEFLLAAQTGPVGTPEDGAANLVRRGLSPLEGGWVLKRLFGLSMPRAAHLVEAARVRKAARNAPAMTEPGDTYAAPRFMFQVRSRPLARREWTRTEDK